MANTPEVSDYTSIQERVASRFDLAAAIHEQTEQHFYQRFGRKTPACNTS